MTVRRGVHALSRFVLVKAVTHMYPPGSLPPATTPCHMSLTITTTSSSLLPTLAPRKRTTSFSHSTFAPNPRPTKAPRMVNSLRRTTTYLTLPGSMPDPSSAPASTHTTDVPYSRTLRHYKEQREKRKALLNRAHIEPITIRTHKLEISESNIKVHFPQTTPTPKPSSIIPSTPQLSPRASSPLAPKPNRIQLPPRTFFPRSKPEPNLYRQALIARMKSSPEGQKMLTMGPRLAVSIYTATKELEKIIAAQTLDTDRDTEMGDATSPGGAVMSGSWVVVPGEDWEMIDCGA